MRFLKRAVVWKHLGQLNEIENKLYGPDFACEVSDLAHWTASPLFFYEVVGREIGGGVSVDALGSLLVVDRYQVDLLREGSIREAELAPWQDGKGRAPYIYFSSLYSRIPGGGKRVMMQLVSRLASVGAGVAARGIVGISSSLGGQRFLRRSGFAQEGQSYLGKYAFASIDGVDWSRILVDSLDCSRAEGTTLGVFPSLRSPCSQPTVPAALT